MKVFTFVAAILSLGMVGVAAAQSSMPDAPKTSLADGSSSSAHLGSVAPSLAMGGDLTSRNLLVFGVSTGASYDTLGLYNSTTGKFSGDDRYFVQPSIAYQRTAAQGSFTLSYTPGFSYSPEDQNNDQYTQNAAVDFSYRPNYRWLIHGRQDYSRTDNPFETVGRVDLLPGLGGALGTGYNGVVPDTRRTDLVSNFDMTYAVGEHTALGFTGGYQKSQYDSTQSSSASFSYENSQSMNGSFFLSHQLSQQLTFGVQATYADYYTTGLERTRVQAPAPLLFIKVLPNPHMELTLYAGPQEARLHESYTSGGVTVTEPLRTNWYPNLGATLTVSRQRQAFSLNADERVSNGGGVLSAVRNVNASAGYRLRMMQHLTGEARVAFTNQKAIGTYSEGDYLRSVWAGGGPSVELTHFLNLHCEVAYVHQEEHGLSPVAGNHLLVQGSLDFRFKKNLGD
ncbi:MAG: hypothetical protein P4M01_10915 [Acidobacteriota bacterium]|nr:hypothetical protein [Acidobacteriota bacterium]